MICICLYYNAIVLESLGNFCSLMIIISQMLCISEEIVVQEGAGQTVSESRF